MKVILDTNVLLSGFYFGGVPGRILEAWSAGRIVPALSPSILSEYREAAFELEARYGPTHFESFVSLLLVHAEVVDAPASLPTQVCTDPHDDKFLACALVSSAKVVITGDRALLAVNGWSDLELSDRVRSSTGIFQIQHNAMEVSCGPCQRPHARTAVRSSTSGFALEQAARQLHRTR